MSHDSFINRFKSRSTPSNTPSKQLLSGLDYIKRIWLLFMQNNIRWDVFIGLLWVAKLSWWSERKDENIWGIYGGYYSYI